MIFFQPIILASEFVRHASIIVLIGVLFVECFARCNGANAIKRRSVVFLLAVAFAGGVMLLIEYFFHAEKWWMIMAPIFLAGILFMIFRFRQRYIRNVGSVPSFYAVVWTLGILIIISIMYNFFTTAIVYAFSSLFQTAATVTFYFFALEYLILTDHDKA